MERAVPYTKPHPQAPQNQPPSGPTGTKPIPAQKPIFSDWAMI